MTQRAFAFERPNWQSPGRINVRLGLLLLASLAWLLIYGGLGWRIWATDTRLLTPVNFTLTLLSIGLGIAVFMGWRRIWPLLRLRWAGRDAASPWPALSQEELQNLTPAEFEAYVAYRVFERQGYRVVNTADVKDGGIDIRLIDSLGYEAIVQCKRYASTVGVGTVRDLYGTMLHEDADYGYLVTSGPISADAREWAADKPIGLIDGEMVAALSRAEADLTYLQSIYRPIYQ